MSQMKKEKSRNPIRKYCSTYPKLIGETEFGFGLQYQRVQHDWGNSYLTIIFISCRKKKMN